MTQQLSPQQQNLKVQRWVALVSVILLIVKFTAYYFTASVAILTDATESIVNVVAGLIGVYSLYIAARPRDVNHPYGHGKAEFLSAGIEGVLMGLAGVFILYEAIHKFFHPVSIKKIDLGIVLITATAIVNYILGSVCVNLGKKNKSLALEASGRHLQTDTYSTLAILIGLAVLYFTGLAWVDYVVAVLLSVFLIYISYKIIRRSIAGIMDEADENFLTEMITLANEHRRSNWVDLHNLRVIKYGSILHIDAHLTLPWYFNLKETHKEVDAFSDLIRKEYGESLELFIHSDGCAEERQCPICIKNDCELRQQPLNKKIKWTFENVVDNKKHSTQTSSLNYM